MDAAMAVFAEKGYAATTVDDIVRAAGASPATFYLHFPRKVDVLRASVEDEAAQISHLSESLQAPGGRVTGNILRAWAEKLFNYWNDLRPTQKILRQAAVVEPELGAIHLDRLAEGIDFWEAFLVGAGAVAGPSLRTEATLIDATFVGLYEMSVVSDIPLDASAVADAVAADLLRRLRHLRRSAR